jgi:hypothetical protein
MVKKMAMKTRIIMITTILAMACMVWLIGENRAYKARLNEMIIKQNDFVDRYFDLQTEYEHCFDAVNSMEMEMDTILKYAHGLEEKLMMVK